MQPLGYVYKTTNLINGKAYIGKREAKEFYEGYKGSGLAIRRAVRKYGSLHFKVELIAYAQTREELNELEVYYIKEIRKLLSPVNVYNIAPGGQGVYGGDKHPMFGRVGKKPLMETREKIRRTHTGYRYSDEARLNLGRAVKARGGRPLEVVNKVALANTGKKRTPEQRLRMSLAKMSDKNPMRKKCTG